MEIEQVYDYPEYTEEQLSNISFGCLRYIMNKDIPELYKYISKAVSLDYELAPEYNNADHYLIHSIVRVYSCFMATQTEDKRLINQATFTTLDAIGAILSKAIYI